LSVHFISKLDTHNGHIACSHSRVEGVSLVKGVNNIESVIGKFYI